jgi:hypothetical protein
LAPGVPYVRGWAAAKRSTDALARELLTLGLDSDFPALKPDVNVMGEGLVNVGALRPEAAELLAWLIGVGLAAEAAQLGTDGTRPASAPLLRGA